MDSSNWSVGVGFIFYLPVMALESMNLCLAGEFTRWVDLPSCEGGLHSVPKDSRISTVTVGFIFFWTWLGSNLHHLRWSSRVLNLIHWNLLGKSLWYRYNGEKCVLVGHTWCLVDFLLYSECIACVCICKHDAIGAALMELVCIIEHIYHEWLKMYKRLF